MPTIQIPKKCHPILTTNARIVVLVGGRSSAKSETMGRVLLMKCQTEGADILCGREYQNSIDDSVHKLLKTLITKIPTNGFRVLEKKIDCSTGGSFRYRGFSRSPDTVKSAQDFKYSWIEEAQSLSQISIDVLLPTIRAEGSKLYFTANPQSSADPFSKRFIVPFLHQLQTQGYYEDDMHLIIMVNWRDNPWHGELETLRQFDFETMSRAKYDWIWEGAFNDSVEDALIMAEWFDACIDAHKKLGFKPEGIRFSSHDPSDIGPDNKGFAFRHGSVLLDLQEKTDGDINEGGDWALGLALNHNSDAFTWDCDGMGVGLNRQVTRAFHGKHTLISMFKGSEGVDHPDAIFRSIMNAEFRDKNWNPRSDSEKVPIQDQKTNKDALKNKRAQYYLELRNRMYKTFRAINGEYHDPDELISFDSSIALLPKLRSELCRMPVKPNGAGKFDLYFELELKSKFKFDSPNLADSVMMLTRTPYRVNVDKFAMPQPIKPMGKTLKRRH